MNCYYTHSNCLNVSNSETLDAKADRSLLFTKTVKDHPYKLVSADKMSIYHLLTPPLIFNKHDVKACKERSSNRSYVDGM